MKLSAGGCFYNVVTCLGSGAYGRIYKGIDELSKEEVAIKISQINSSQSLKISNEECIMKRFENIPGFLKSRYYGVDGDVTILVLEIGGSNLEVLMKRSGGQLSLKSVLMIADQIIERLQYIHKLGYVHRDIKPSNLLIGCGKTSNIIHVIDFGLSKKYINSSGSILKFNEHQPFIGTPNFASSNTHHGCCPSPRDDIESLFYTIIYLFKGNLPWMGSDKDINEIANMKKNISSKDLCSGLPPEFEINFQLVRELKYEQIPDYSKIRSAFRSVFIQNEFYYDYCYDWVPSPIKYVEPKTSRALATSTKVRSCVTIQKTRSSYKSITLFKKFP